MSGRRVVLAVVVTLVLVFAFVLSQSPEKNETTKEITRSICPLQEYSSPADLEQVGVFNGTIVYRTEDGFAIKVKNSTYLINASEVFFFNWSFVAVRNESEMRKVPFVKFSVDAYGRTNVSTGNLTAEVPVVVLRACSYDGKPLWNITFSGYTWAYDGGKYGVKENGMAVPGVMITNTSDYLYALVYQTAPRPYSEFRNYAPDDYFYVLGRNGTVKKFDLGRGFLPLRNAFLVSNGSYVLMGFERPLPDGSPMSGYVMILNGTKVIWSRLFQMNDPSCLCYVIPGWGRIDKNGCATFGLYDGEGKYCDGKFTYIENSTG
ncbi:hypothetical protein [Thermococcus sp.]|uniref:hypothetical protein n=1 Tax=Thermococcus sp. TaxID=35749 RepID=UPI00262FBF48|nr:hypothetical protein [Thermococcus sp.]